MKAITAIGIVGSLVVLLLAVILEGGNPMALIGIPPFIVVIGGTACATAASTSMAQLKHVPKLLKLIVSPPDLDPVEGARQMVRLSEKARREGLLALENELGTLSDPFARKGVQLLVDGVDSELIRDVLQSEMDGMSSRHHMNMSVFATAGGFAPTLGILGTVLSLVHVLENLSDPGTLGGAIASAFLATLYGVGSANLVFLPIGNKLKEMSLDETLYRGMLLDAVLAIQAGDNPRMLAEKLDTFLPPEQRGQTDSRRLKAAAEPEGEAEAA
jgi:chemotaxis protein MotA